MRFIYDGDYTVRDGVTFLFRNPTTVENKITIEKLLKDPMFKKEEDVPIERIDACPKCGRVVRQGRYMHEKFCVGKPK